MYTILCVIELLKAACPSTLPLKINHADRLALSNVRLMAVARFLRPSRKLITASPRATHPRFTVQSIRIYGPKPCPCAVNWILLPYKSSGAFQKINALVYVLKLTVCIDTEEIELIVDSVPKSIKADLIKGVLTIKIGCDCDRLSGHYKRGD